MKLYKWLMVVGLVLGLSTGSIAAKTDNAGFSEVQTLNIEKIIHDYLVNNPEVLLEASKSLQLKQQQDRMSQAQKAIDTYNKDLFNHNSPVVGNDKGDITLVEFFDYQCSHCKKSSPIVEELINKNKNLKVVYKEFPIFGRNSEYAALAALAARNQGKYVEMHHALMGANKRLNKKVVLSIASSVGLNVDKLEYDIKNGMLKKELQATFKLAEKLNLTGTPSFVIASTPDGSYKIGNKSFFVPGAASQQMLQQMIEEVGSSK